MNETRSQDWIFTVRYFEPRGLTPRPLPVDRWAVVGPARSSTVEAALHLAKVPEDVRVEIRSHAVIRDFVDGRLDPDRTGYYVQGEGCAWVVCIGSVHEVLG